MPSNDLKPPAPTLTEWADSLIPALADTLGLPEEDAALRRLVRRVVQGSRCPSKQADD